MQRVAPRKRNKLCSPPAGLFGVSPGLSVSVAALLLVLLLVSGSYRRVEIVGITLGL